MFLFKKLFNKKWIILIAGLMLSSACSQPKPGNIHYGVDACSHCQMIISDSRFASELITSKGKVYKFDSVECLAGYLKDNPESQKNAKLWVSDLITHDKWIPAGKAVYLHSQTIKSPMGMGFSAYETQTAADSMQTQYGGDVMNWDMVLNWTDRHMQ